MALLPSGKASQREFPIHLMDGGLGTLLTSPPHNFDFDHTHPLWSSHLLTSISGQEELAKAQQSFVDAGAEYLLTATYQASFEGFAATKVADGKHENGFTEEEAENCMRKAVDIVKDCLDRGARSGKKGTVVLSLGAYGATMVPGAEYSGLYDEGHRSVSQLRDWHARRLNVFFTDDLKNQEKAKCWETIDMCAYETLPTRNEIIAVRGVMSLQELKGPTRPFWISCVFPGDKNLLPDGSTMEEVVNAMLGEQAVPGERNKLALPFGIGINCTKLGKLESLILEMEDAVGKVLNDTTRSETNRQWPTLIVYPDGTKGEVYNTTTKQWEKSEFSGEDLGPWDEKIFAIIKRASERCLWSGLVVGGCCKTTPEDIAKLYRRIEQMN